MRFQYAGSRNNRHGFQSKLTKHKLRKYKWRGLARVFLRKSKEATSRHLKMENTYRRGVKRKWEGDHEEDYVKMRSNMYDLFYKKFHSRIPGKEVPLLRSILLRESIRSLEYELFEEGLMRSQQAAEAAIDTPMAQLTLDPIPDTFSFPLPSSPLPAFTEVPQGIESDQSDFVTLASKLVDSLTESGIVDLLQSSSMSQEESMPQSSLMSSPPQPMYCNLQPPSAIPTSSSSSSSAFSGSYNMYSSPSSHSHSQAAAVVDSTGLQPVGSIPSLPASAYDGVAMDITPSLPPFSSWAPSLLSHEVLDGGDSNNNSSSSSMSSSSTVSCSSSTLGPHNYMLSGEEVGVAVAAAAADWGDFSEQDVMDLLQSCQQKQEAALVASGADSAALPSSPPTSVSSSSSSPSSNPGLGGQCVTFCRSDSAVDELDSIMQVIVGN